jgi:hypothetical protein
MARERHPRATLAFPVSLLSFVVADIRGRLITPPKVNDRERYSSMLSYSRLTRRVSLL